MRRLPLLLCGLAVSTPAWPCCGFTQGIPALFVGQSNIIVWDDENGVEHFIRDARFSGSKDSLGFVAPTPSEPELSSVNPVVYQELAALRPRDPSWKLGATAAADSAVEVLRVQDVAGYRAVVLKATDSQALADWLSKNKFKSSPTIDQWLDFYVKKGWYFTAFTVKVDKSGNSSTGPVRISFRTEKPYNPFLVPKDNVPLKRGSGVQLMFVARGVYKADNKSDWQEPQWEAWVPSETVEKLKASTTIKAWPRQPVVSYYADPGFPNALATDDVYFSYSREYRPPAWEVEESRRKTLTLVGLVVFLIGGGILFRRAGLKKTAAS